MMLLRTGAALETLTTCLLQAFDAPMVDAETLYCVASL